MNTYAKYCPNVFLAKCPEQHQKGDIILLETKYGKQHECVVFNKILEKGWFFYYSIVRADGFNFQEWAKRRAEKLSGYAANSSIKSDNYYQAAQEGKDLLVLAEPIKIGHHSEKIHRALIDRNYNRMKKSIEFSKKSDDYAQRIAYWEDKASTINLSMPESMEYFEYKLEVAKDRHEGLKSGKYKRDHSFSLTYAKKEVNEIEKKLELANKLWG